MNQLVKNHDDTKSTKQEHKQGQSWGKKRPLNKKFHPTSKNQQY
jgi:hypothetical protein